MTDIDLENKIIYQYYKGENSDVHEAYVNKVFCDDKKEEELKHLLLKQFYELLSEDDINDIDDKDLDHILHKIHFDINTTTAETKNKKFPTFLNWSVRIAGMVILPLVIFWGIKGFQINKSSKKTWIEINAPAWTRTNFSLPDGTTGWLTSNSSISYKGNFIHDRHVSLKGEALFDVAGDKNNPFVVSTDKVDIKVIGTRFNVASYENEKVIEVVLKEGELIFYNNEVGKSYILQPNDLIVYDKIQKDCKIEVVEPVKYLSWTEGRLVFRNDSLDVVARKLERWFNIDVEIVGDFSDQPSLRATFVDESIEEILNLMGKSLNIHYKIISPGLNEDKTYSKMKVILSPL